MAEMMRAAQYAVPGEPVRVNAVPVPEPGPGEVLLRVTAAGVCHSDIAVMEMPAGTFPLPMTLGHEGAGVVCALGPGATGVEIGEPVLVYGAWGCGVCRSCAEGAENYCPRAAGLGILPPGLGSPGAIADYLLVRSPRHLVPLGDLDPVAAVPLTDAGLTPYHAIRRSLPRLRPGGTAVVIGAGGLGHVAIQLLRALSPARVIATDVSDQKLALAADVGAHETVRADGPAAAAVRKLTGDAGADLVLDFVGAQSTVELAGTVAGPGCHVTVVGLGTGALPVGFGRLPWECSVTSTYWGTRPELMDLVELARAGAVKVHVEEYDLDDAPRAYERLHEGSIRGRAVIVP